VPFQLGASVIATLIGSFFVYRLPTEREATRYIAIFLYFPLMTIFLFLYATFFINLLFSTGSAAF
jgi:hypothetical protein